MNIKEPAKKFTKEEFIELFGYNGLDMCPGELGFDNPRNCESFYCRDCLKVAIDNDEHEEYAIKFKNNKIYLHAVQYFGKTSRKQLAQEECAELIQALSKDLRGMEHNVEEEIADVLIMIEQLTHIYDNGKIEKYREEKINRLNKLMENQEDINEQ